MALLNVRHLLRGVDLLNQNILSLAIEVNHLAQMNEFHLELVVGVEFKDGGDFIYFPFAFGECDAVFKRSIA